MVAKQKRATSSDWQHFLFFFPAGWQKSTATHSSTFDWSGWYIYTTLCIFQPWYCPLVLRKMLLKNLVQSICNDIITCNISQMGSFSLTVRTFCGWFEYLQVFPSCTRSETKIVLFPLYRATIISHDCQVSLEKLGQSNLVHCPHRLELPFLPLSSSRPAVVWCVGKNAPLMKRTPRLADRDFISTNDLQSGTISLSALFNIAPLRD